ncbi:MAG TPA: DUF2911 domain-containing protein [Chitinophagaceae bacterium]|nr:DUF2911 domain-containing protein [Chitinophagaceae bacterium]
MRKILFAAAAILFVSSADAQLKTPAPSPTQTIKQDFGLSSIELTYSRPGMKNRKVFGDLVPWGKLWRTGANAATRIKFADDVTLGTQTVKAGDYVLYTIPSEKEWEIIINKGITNWGIDGYKPEEDVAHLTVSTSKTEMSIETFTMQFVNVTPNTCELRVQWENTAVNIPIATDVESKVMAQIDQQMNKDNRPYFNAAMYYMETGKDLNQALAWFDKAVEQNPTAFWMHHQRANCLAKLGKKDEAKLAAQKSKDLATKENNQDYVKLNEKLLAELNK